MRKVSTGVLEPGKLVLCHSKKIKEFDALRRKVIKIIWLANENARNKIIFSFWIGVEIFYFAETYRESQIVLRLKHLSLSYDLNRKNLFVRTEKCFGSHSILEPIAKPKVKSFLNWIGKLQLIELTLVRAGHVVQVSK